MDPQLIQNLRYKLQRRVRRLNSVDWPMFVPALKQFWVFFDGIPTYLGISEILSAQNRQVPAIVDKIFAGEGVIGSTEEESAAMGQAVLRRLATEQNVHLATFMYGYEGAGNASESLEMLRDLFLEPFYEYVDEKLDDQSAMLALLYRYKHRCEWFYRDHLAQLAQDDTRKAESLLSLDPYAFLHDQGIDFSIEPSSITGKVDLIAAQDSADPLLADAKIFDGDSRGKTYIRKAFNQVYTYAQQFNQPFGYLIIYRITDKDLRFTLSTPSRTVPVVIYNHKTIFLLSIDINLHPKPVSQREPLSVIEITEEELVALDPLSSAAPVEAAGSSRI